MLRKFATGVVANEKAIEEHRLPGCPQRADKQCNEGAAVLTAARRELPAPQSENENVRWPRPPLPQLGVFYS